MRDENSVLEEGGQLVQHVFRAKAPLRGPDHQDKGSAWTIAIKGWTGRSAGFYISSSCPFRW